MNKDIYEKQMEEAAHDEDFMERTNACQDSFVYSDSDSVFEDMKEGLNQAIAYEKGELLVDDVLDENVVVTDSEVISRMKADLDSTTTVVRVRRTESEPITYEKVKENAQKWILE